jgi:hypothetical protein
MNAARLFCGHGITAPDSLHFLTQKCCEKTGAHVYTPRNVICICAKHAPSERSFAEYELLRKLQATRKTLATKSQR